MDKLTREQEPGRHIPLVDRQAVESLIMDQKNNITDQAGDFFSKNEELQAALLLGFETLGDEASGEIYIGAGTAAVLEDSQKRTGGAIPKAVEGEAIDAAIVSAQERSKGGASDAIKDLFDSDRELFLALTLLAHKMKVAPGHLLQGGALLRDIYKHIIESEEFGKQFPSIS